METRVPAKEYWPGNELRCKHTSKGERKFRNMCNTGNSSSVVLSDTNSRHGIGDTTRNKMMHRSTIRPIKNLHMRRRFPKLSPMLLKKTDVIVSPSSGDDDERKPIKNLYMRRRFPKLSPMLLKKTDVIVSPISSDDDERRKRQKVEEREPSESDDRNELVLKKTPISSDDDERRKRQKVEEREPSESDDRNELVLSTPEAYKVKRLSRMLAELLPHNGLGLKPDPYEIYVTRRPRTTQVINYKEEEPLLESPRKKRKVETPKNKMPKTKVSLRSEKQAESTPRRRGKRMLSSLAPFNNNGIKDETDFRKSRGRRGRVKRDVRVSDFRSM